MCSIQNTITYGQFSDSPPAVDSFNHEKILTRTLFIRLRGLRTSGCQILENRAVCASDSRMCWRWKNVWKKISLIGSWSVNCFQSNHLGGLPKNCIKSKRSKHHVCLLKTLFSLVILSRAFGKESGTSDDFWKCQGDLKHVGILKAFSCSVHLMEL